VGDTVTTISERQY